MSKKFMVNIYSHPTRVTGPGSSTSFISSPDVMIGTAADSTSSGIGGSTPQTDSATTAIQESCTATSVESAASTSIVGTGPTETVTGTVVDPSSGGC